MPRRIPDYPDAYYGWNYLSSIGSIISVIATLIFVLIIYKLFTNPNTLVDQVKEEEGHEFINKSPWLESPYFVTLMNLFSNAPFSSTLENGVISPIPTHVYNNLPIFGENETKDIIKY